MSKKPEAEEKELVLEVGEEARGERLDRFAAGRFENESESESERLSRSRLQRLIEEGRVRVDGRAARAKETLKGGERITIHLPAPAETEMKGEEIPLDILFEDDDILVLNKPAGLVVHPAPGNTRGTLVNAILHHAPMIEGVGGVRRPGLVQRLDKDTTGVMVVAKSGAAYQTLVAAMKRREIHRTYLAVVQGWVQEDEGLIEAPIGRDHRDRKKMAVIGSGRKAVTHFQVKARSREASLLEVDLETGRTHQIRVHLAHIGYPVAGDPVYGGRRAKEWAEGLIDRQALHAFRLRFRHPVTEEELSFEAPPPEDLRRLMTALELE